MALKKAPQKPAPAPPSRVPEVKKPSLLKRLLFGLIGVVLMLALGVGGTIAIFRFLPDLLPGLESAGTGTNEQASGQRSEAGRPERRPRTEVQYFRFVPDFLVNTQPDEFGNSQYLKVTVEVSSRDKQTLQDLERHMPLIRQDLLFLFSSQTAADLGTLEGKRMLREETLATINRDLQAQTGYGLVDDVFFTSLVIQ